MAGVSRTFLQFFWDLADTDNDKRRCAGEEIISHLVKVQGEFETESNTDEGENTLGEFAPDVQYSLKRLIKGLSSGRDSARQGFASTLTQMLIEFPRIPLSETFSLICETTKVGGGMKSAEERDLMFGRVVGFLALKRANRFKATEGNVNEDDDASPSGFAVQSVKHLLALCTKKGWLREFCYEAVLSIISDIPLSYFLVHVLPLVEPILEEKPRDYTADQLLLAVGVQSYILAASQRAAAAGDDVEAAAGVAATQKGGLWGGRGALLVRGGRFGKIAGPLQASSSVFPRVHSVWEHVFGEILKKDKKAGREVVDTELLQELWSEVVDGVLARGTHERKGLALVLLQRLLPRVQPQHVGVLLSPALLRLLLNNLADEENYLHKQAHGVLETLMSVASTTTSTSSSTSPVNTDYRVAVLATLLGSGELQFDSRSRTTTVATLMADMDGDSLRRYTEYLMGVVLDQTQAQGEGEGEGEKAAEAAEAAAAAAGKRVSLETLTVEEEKAERERQVRAQRSARRVWALDALFAAARNPQLPRTEAWMQEVLQFLMLHAFFRPPADAPVEGGKQGAKKRRRSTVSAKETAAAAEKEGTAGLAPPLTGPIHSCSPVLWRAAQPALQPATLEVCAQRFFSLLGELSATHAHRFSPRHEAEEDGAATGSSSGSGATLGKTADGELWAHRVHLLWDGLVGAGATPLHPDEEVTEQRDVAMVTVNSIRTRLGKPVVGAMGRGGSAAASSDEEGESVKSRQLLAAFELLFLQVGAQLLQPEAGTRREAAEALEEMQAVFTALGSREMGGDSQKKGEEDDDEDGEEPDPIVVLVDVLISLLTQNSALLREVVKQAFKALVACTPVPTAAVEEMVRVVSSRSTAQGARDMFAMEVEEDEEDEEDDDMTPMDEAEIAAIKAKMAAQFDDEDEEEEEEEEEEEGEKEEEEEDDEEAAMDRADSALAAMLRSLQDRKDKNSRNSNSSKSTANVRRQALHLKHRVLDLLVILAARQPRSPALLSCVLPLTEAVRELHQRPDELKEGQTLMRRLTDFVSNKLGKFPISLAPHTAVAGGADAGAGGAGTAAELAAVAAKAEAASVAAAEKAEAAAKKLTSSKKGTPSKKASSAAAAAKKAAAKAAATAAEAAAAAAAAKAAEGGAGGGDALQLAVSAEESAALVDTAHETLQKLLDIARRAPDGGVLSCVSSGLLVLARALAAVPGGGGRLGEVGGLYATIATELLSKHHSKLGAVLVTDCIERLPEVAWGMAPTLVAMSGAHGPTSGGARSLFDRCEAFRLLTTLLRARFRKSKRRAGATAAAAGTAVADVGKDMAGVEGEALQSACLSYIRDAVEEGEGEAETAPLLNNKRIRLVLSYAAVALPLAQTSGVELDLGWGELLQRLQRVARGGGIKGMAVNLVRLLDPSAADIAQKERRLEKEARLKERKRKREEEEAGKGGGVKKSKGGEDTKEAAPVAEGAKKTQSAIDRKRKKLAKAKKAALQAKSA